MISVLMMSEFVDPASRHKFVGLLMLPWGVATLTATVVYGLYEYWRILTIYVLFC
jgi:hypothetical protein